MAHRADLNSLSPVDRQTLVNLMLNYLTDAVVAQHASIVHSGLSLFTGHRAYIAGMETFLSANGGGAFVPLPQWNPINPIPPEFNVVKPEDDSTPRPALINLNPNMATPKEFEMPQVCDFESGDDLGNAINGWHGGVHVTIGGTMGFLSIASAAPIFWCWHAFVDHVYWNWQSCQVVTPSVCGYSLPLAKHYLHHAGLKVGHVTHLQKCILQPEYQNAKRKKLPKQMGRDFDGRPLLTPETLRRLQQRGPLVIQQTPAAGQSVHVGAATHLVVVPQPAPRYEDDYRRDYDEEDYRSDYDGYDSEGEEEHDHGAHSHAPALNGGGIR